MLNFLHKFPDYSKLSHLKYLLSVFVIVYSGTCASVPTVEHSNYIENDFKNTTHRILILPLQVPPQLNISEDAKFSMELLIEYTLQIAGYDIFTADDWNDIYQKNQRNAGGLYDPITGKLDESKEKIIWQSTLKEIQKQFEFDAVLIPSVHIVLAKWSSYFGNAEATWDKVSENIQEDFDFGALLGGRTSFGTISALSLYVTLVNQEQDELYSKKAGIQVLARIHPYDQFVKIPENKLLTNNARNQNAINIVLEPLVGKKKAKDKSETRVKENERQNDQQSKYKEWYEE